MNATIRSVAATLALTLLGTLCTVERASAGCSPVGAEAGLVGWQAPESVPQLRYASYFQTDFAPRPVIVGLWQFEFTAKGNGDFIPDGAPIDAGYVTWHEDGTELMNSGRAPMTGSFCMGVWRQVAPYTFKLNHVAMSWDPTGTVFVGPANIRETIKVDRSGNSYSGTFTLDQYASDGVTVLAHITGTVHATRITVN
jgi:hypothetical protein